MTLRNSIRGPSESAWNYASFQAPESRPNSKKGFSPGPSLSTATNQQPHELPHPHHHLHRSNHLPRMPLRMLRAMHQQPTHRTRQHPPPNSPHLRITSRRNPPNPALRQLHSARKLPKQIIPRRTRHHLALQSRHLHLIQLQPHSISQQPIQTPNHMTHLKPHRRQPQRPSLQLRITQPPTPQLRILRSQPKRMHHPAPQRIKLLQPTPQPRLNHQTPSRLSTRRSKHPA